MRSLGCGLATALGVYTAAMCTIASKLPNFYPAWDHVTEPLNVVLGEGFVAAQMPKNSKDLAVLARSSGKEVHGFIPNRELRAGCVPTFSPCVPLAFNQHGWARRPKIKLSRAHLRIDANIDCKVALQEDAPTCEEVSHQDFELGTATRVVLVGQFASLKAVAA